MVSSGPLLGREPEIAALSAFVEAGFEQGSVLLIIGEPGIGKTALLTSGRAVAHEAGYTLLQAVGVESKMHLPFGGLHQALTPLMKHLDSLLPTQRDALATALVLRVGKDFTVCVRDNEVCLLLRLLCCVSVMSRS